MQTKVTIPSDLESDLKLTAKWGAITVEEVKNILRAMIASKMKDSDLLPKPTKSTTAYQNSLDKKTAEIWKKISPKYTGNLKGNQYFSAVHHIVDGQSRFERNILKRFRPFQKG